MKKKKSVATSDGLPHWKWMVVVDLVLGTYAVLNVVLILLYAGMLSVTILAPVIIVLGLSSIACLFLLHWRRNIFTRAYYILGVTWIGLVLIQLLVLVPVFVLRALFHYVMPPLVVMFIMLVVAILGVWAAMVPRVNTFSVHTNKRKKPLRIVQLTDMHIGEIHRPSDLRRTVRRTNELRPDVVVITGDLFDGGEHYAGMITPLRELKAKHVLFVTGNHEVYTGAEECKKRIRALGIQIIDEQLVTIDHVQFAGISYALGVQKAKEFTMIRQLGARLNRKLPAVMLHHTPNSAREASLAGFDIQLSGHTHAGQMWPFTLLIPIAHKEVVGKYRFGKLLLYVSPGTGTWGPPFRIGSRSEITCIELS